MQKYKNISSKIDKALLRNEYFFLILTIFIVTKLYREKYNSPLNPVFY